MPPTRNAFTCTKMSGPPEASSMKPNPRLASQVFNLPVGINSLSGLLARRSLTDHPPRADNRLAIDQEGLRLGGCGFAHGLDHPSSPMTSYSNTTPSGSFTTNHSSARSEFANTLRWSRSPTCFLVSTYIQTVFIGPS